MDDGEVVGGLGSHVLAVLQVSVGGHPPGGAQSSVPRVPPGHHGPEQRRLLVETRRHVRQGPLVHHLQGGGADMTQREGETGVFFFC